MSTARFHVDDKLFSGAFAVMAEALAHLPKIARHARVSTAPKLGFWDRLDAWYWRCEQRDREAYLCRAQTAADLESRLREYERNADRGF